MTVLKMGRHPTDTTARLFALREEVEQRLLQNADYRAMLALDNAIRELATACPPPEAAHAPSGAPSAKLSRANAASLVLAEQGRPLAFGELAERVRNRGASLEGKGARRAFSVTLSTDGRFRSVRYRQRRCWWFTDRPFPGDPEASEQKPRAGASGKPRPKGMAGLEDSRPH